MIEALEQDGPCVLHVANLAIIISADIEQAQRLVPTEAQSDAPILRTRVEKFRSGPSML